MSDRRSTVLIAGGGSGGHVFPGLAVAEELARRGFDVAWAGASRSMEERLVRRHGLPFHPLAARPVVGRGPIGRASALFTLAGSALGARALLGRLGVRAVLGTGGYVSVPAAVGAKLAGIPLVLLEPNAEPGLANRALSRLAREAVVAHDSPGVAALRCPVTVTGVPVRGEFFDVAPRLPFGAPLRLLVLGGSQGARRLNELMPEALERLDPELGQVLVRHQAGHRHVDAVRAAYTARGLRVSSVEGGGFSPEGPRVQIEVVPFLHDMAGALAESHLVVSRAGAITLAELCAAGRPALLAPLELAGGHQQANARRLAEAGAVEVLDADADAENLAAVLASLLEKRPSLERMAEAARALGRVDAASVIADRVERWADSNGSDGSNGSNGDGAAPERRAA